MRRLAFASRTSFSLVTIRFAPSVKSLVYFLWFLYVEPSIKLSTIGIKMLRIALSDLSDKSIFRPSVLNLTSADRLVRSQTENPECRGDLFEFRKRRIFVHEHVGSRSRCSLQVSFQDGCPLSAGTSSSWISSRPPLRRTALPPAARTL